MKKNIPYLAILLPVAAAILLIIAGQGKDRKFNERLSFRKKDKIPYGMYVAYNNLKYLFPDSKIYPNRNGPGYWDSLSISDPDQALIIISPRFFADEPEMKKIFSFIENGNTVFISTIQISDEAENMIRCKTSLSEFSNFVFGKFNISDSFSVSLSDPPFEKKSKYTYPGFKYSAWFYRTDSLTVDTLGYERNKKINFVHLRAGKGHLYIHLAPLAFSNYFLLHKNNIRYYENVLSLIQPDVVKIVWDEYYLNKRENYDKKRNNWITVLFQYLELKAALLTVIFTLLLYLLMEMRRKQRYIPFITKPRNDSLDFVKTIGRLYFDKGDHLNLCRKMAAYFLEHIRNVYKLPTNNLNEEFIKALQFKTGIAETEIAGIVSFIRKLDGVHIVSDKQLSSFHKQLESFYKTA